MSCNITAGVPQGSILGHLLFKIFVNDFGFDLASDSYLFANDATLMYQYEKGQHGNATTIVKSDLNKLATWASNWCITFNTKNTVLMNCTPCSSVPSVINVVFGSDVIESSCSHMHLGVILAADLSWSAHIDYFISQSSSMLGLLRQQAIHLSFVQKSQIYLSIIRPRAEYGSVLYDSCSSYYVMKLEQFQRNASLVCSGAKYRTDNKQLMNFLRWISLVTRRSVAKLNLFYLIMCSTTPAYLCNLIQKHTPSTHRT